MAETTVRARLRMAKNPPIEPIAPVEVQITADDGYTPVSATHMDEDRCNPLAEILDDSTYALLAQHRLLDERSVRNYSIRKAYRELRTRMSSTDAFEQLHELYSYLEFDTIRKIVYQDHPKLS